MRGMKMPPHFLPAHGWETRIQQELFSSAWLYRSQWNCTFTRPYLSVWISSPCGPTTIAVCGPRIIGLGVVRGVRKGVLASMAMKLQPNVVARPRGTRSAE